MTDDLKQAVDEAMAWRVKERSGLWFTTDRPDLVGWYRERGHEIEPLYPLAARRVDEPGEMERLKRLEEAWARMAMREHARAETAEAALAETRERLEKMEAQAAANGRAGIEAAARYVEALWNAHTEEFGIYDPETNATEFRGASEDIDGLYQELIEGIRSLDAARPDRARAVLSRQENRAALEEPGR